LRFLIGLAQTGDKQARQQLVAALRPRLVTMARHYARCCHEDYDDLLGEAWFAVFDALEVIDVTIGEPEQFLLKRARWRMLDYVKWAARRRCDEHDADQCEDHVLDVAPQVVDQDIVCQVLATLSDTQQAVLRGLLSGHTWREVAGRLGCSSANVAYHVRQIRLRCEGIVDEVPA